MLLEVKIEKAHQAMQRDERHFTELFVFGKSYLGKNITQKDNNDNKIFDVYSLIDQILDLFFKVH